MDDRAERPWPPLLVETLAITAIASGVLVLLGWFVFPVRVVLALALGCGVAWRLHGGMHDARPGTVQPTARWSMVAILAGGTAALLLLAAYGTTDPIRSPWSVVPSAFPTLVVLVATAATYAAYARDTRTATIGVMILLALGSAVALLVYRVGFGFDHFIHAAAERVIVAQGSLYPTPLFYSAHYGLVTLLGTVMPWMSLALFDRLLVPVMTLLLVPFVAWCTRKVCAPAPAAFGVLTLAIVPFLPLAVSTPQALANAFALATVFALAAGVPRTAALSAGAALLAQPMTGILAVAAVVAAQCFRARRAALGAATAIAGAVAVPVALAAANALAPHLALATDFAPRAALARIVRTLLDALVFTARDFATADALTLARALLPVAWGITAMIGYRALARIHRDRAQSLAAAALATIGAAFLVMASITVGTQLADEQTQFPMRLLVLAGIVVTPLVAVVFDAGISRIHARTIHIATALLVGAIAATTLALAYPRDDLQERSGLWSVSASDITAVHAISDDAAGTSFVVLANQMLGAAAVRTFGFRPHSLLPDGRELLAFPLPAGGPIAARFWELEGMRPITRAPVDAAMALVNAERAYVVIHDYWRNAPRLHAELAAIAERMLAPIPNLRIYVFSRAPDA